MFNYDRDILADLPDRKQGKFEALRQKFSPRRLGAMLMIELARVTNESVDLDEFKGEYELKYDKIICFRYMDLPLQPFFFTSTAGQLLLLKDHRGNFNTMIESDLNTLLNVLYGNVSMAKARRDGRILIHGEKYGYDEAVFFKIFEKVAPKIQAKLKAEGP